MRQIKINSTDWVLRLYLANALLKDYARISTRC